MTHSFATPTSRTFQLFPQAFFLLGKVVTMTFFFCRVLTGIIFFFFSFYIRLDCWLTSLGDNPFYLKECLGLKNPDSGDKLISLHCVPVVTHLGIPLGTQSCTNMSK